MLFKINIKFFDLGFITNFRKAVGSGYRHVLTDDYKHPESSEEERDAWQNAYNFSNRPSYFSEFLVMG